ncbi:hypothetical protein ABG067_001360 [Albugo candida]
MRVDKESQVFPFSSVSYVYSNYRSKKKPEIMVTTTTCMHPLSTDDVLLSQVLHDTTHRVMYIRRFTQQDCSFIVYYINLVRCSFLLTNITSVN